MDRELAARHSLLAAFVLLFVCALQGQKISLAAGPLHAEAGSPKIFVQKIKGDISLDDLVTSSGYELSDNDVPLFLADFMRLNPTVKSLSLLKKGLVVKLPLEYLTKKAGGSEKAEPARPRQAKKKRSAAAPATAKRPSPAAPRVDQRLVLENIERLFQHLEGRVSVLSDGLKLFSVSERTEIALDTSFLPIIDVDAEHVLIMDYAGVIPDELKNLIEIAWPEYRVVRTSRADDLKGIVFASLQEAGYAVHLGEWVASGGRSLVEYSPDFLVYRKRDSLMTGEFALVTVLGKEELATPDELLAWYQTRGVSMIELNPHKAAKWRRHAGEFLSLESFAADREFAERVIEILGYRATRNRELSLSGRKEYSFKLLADLSIDLGYRMKVIEFAELSAHELQYARRQGVDVICIGTSDGKREIAGKILAIMGITRREQPRETSRFITPEGVRYRLLLPGSYVESRGGAFFLTDSEMGEELMRIVTDNGTKVIKF